MFLIHRFTRPVNELDPRELDAILHAGTALYAQCSRRTGKDYLMVSELEGGVIPYKHQDYIMSIVQECSGLCLPHCQSLPQALDSALKISSYLFVLLGDIYGASYTSAVYHLSDCGFVSFDPHARDSAGLPSPRGTAVVVYHRTRQQLHDYARNLGYKLQATYFEVVAVTFQDITFTRYIE
jgi:hypothetical protein